MNIYLVDFENVNSQGLNGINRLDSNDRIVIFYSENADSMTFELHDQINQSRAYIYFQKVDVGLKNALDFQLATYLGYLICENEKEGKPAVYYVVTKDKGYSSLITYWSKRDVDIALVGSLTQSMKLQKERAADTGISEQEAEEDGAFGAGAEQMALTVDYMVQPQSDAESADEPVHSEAEEHDSAEPAGAAETDDKPEKTVRRTRSRRRSKAEPAADRELRIKVEQAVSDKDVVDLVVSYIQKYKTKLGINNALAKEFKDSKKASEIYKSIKPLIADKKGQ